MSRSCPDWFATPQMGIFIHWGLYSVPAWAPQDLPLDELLRTDFDNLGARQPYSEWYGNAMRVTGSATAAHHSATYPQADYQDFCSLFQNAAAAFDADQWADTFVAAGAGYVVMVAKHHDGYCLWPSAIRNPNRPDWFSQRDFVGELAVATRARGLRFGVYYSGGLDWTFKHEPIANMGDMLANVPTSDTYRAYAKAQVRELIDRYEPSIIWNDIAWPNKADLPDLFDYYRAKVPDGVVNDRWLGESAFFESLSAPHAREAFNASMKAKIAAGESFMGTPRFGDFRTIEYGLGTPPKTGKWEACRGVGLSFGYNQNESTTNYLTFAELSQMRAKTFDQGGNLLINIGPKADGTIPEVQRRALIKT